MKGLYSLFDRGVQKYMIPFPSDAEQDAIRQCRYLVNGDNDSVFKKFPEDFDLYHIGWFVEDEGKLLPLATPKMIVKIIDLVKKEV
nr:MAG: nonstructural protein [Microvirus sp.]